MEPGHSEENNLILTTLVINEEKNINNDKHCSQQNLSSDSVDYFMEKAILASNKSKDPKQKVGACIVNKDLEIVGEGYNRMPNGCSEDELPWERDPNPFKDKLTYVCHAEMNAIVNKSSSNVKNCTLYVTHFPCNECAKIIIESGINKIVYLSNKQGEKPEYRASKRMLEMVKIDLIHLKQFVAETAENKEFLINLKKKNKKIKK